MQAESTIGPELDFGRHDTNSAPEWRARRVGPMSGGLSRNFCHKAGPRRNRLRLRRRPRPKAAFQRARGVIGIRLWPLEAFCHTAHTNLPAQRFPMQNEGCLAGCLDFLPLGAGVIRVEHERIVKNILEQNHANIWQPVGIDACKRNRVRVVRFNRFGLCQPFARNLEGVIPNENTVPFAHSITMVSCVFRGGPERRCPVSFLAGVLTSWIYDASAARKALNDLL